MLPAYLPSADYLLHCWQMNDWNVASQISYDKKFRLNRCQIASSQGPLLLSIPLLHGRNQKARLKDVQIDHTHKWKREHLNSIKSVYGKAPYFIYYFDEISHYIQQHESSLLLFNVNLINLLLRQLRIDAAIQIDDSSSRVGSAEITASVTYRQLFEDKTGFVPSCSAIDLLFNHGPDARHILAAHL